MNSDSLQNLSYQSNHSQQMSKKDLLQQSNFLIMPYILSDIKTFNFPQKIEEQGQQQQQMTNQHSEAKLIGCKKKICKLVKQRKTLSQQSSDTDDPAKQSLYCWEEEDEFHANLKTRKAMKSLKQIQSKLLLIQKDINESSQLIRSYLKKYQ